MHQAIQVVSAYAVHQIIVQVTQAVCCIYGKNPVVHYDLKPRNVLVCNNSTTLMLLL